MRDAYSRPVGALAPPSDTGDVDLALRAGRGDHEAFERLVASWWDRLGRVCAALAGYDGALAEELAGDVLVRLYLGLPRYRGDASFGSFAYRICRNAAADHWRKIARERRRFSGPRPRQSEPIDPAPGPEETWLREEEAQAIRRAMLRLRPQDRALLHLAEGEGLGGVELARIFGIAPGTVKSRLHRLRKRLGALIKEEGHDACPRR